jgi:transcriptional regulator with XRE-family HTH domain
VTADVVQAQGRALAARLRQERAERGWSREHLARLAGVSPRTLERIEVGGTANPGLFTVAALADALDVPLDGLVRAASDGGAGGGLVSAGYEGRTIEDFVGRLVDRGVGTVADVRLTPLSRKPGFSKTRLTGVLGEAGIGYRHLRALGNPKENRPPFWDGRAEEGREVFRRLLQQDPAPAALEELLTMAAGHTVAVLCFEQDEDRCHRKVICDIARDDGLPVAALG